MKVDRKGLLAALLILWQFSVCVAVDSGGISGFYYQDKLSKPLPGALVALYKADDNLLVDYTYTRNDGAFVLKSPPAKGKYYLIATKDKFSSKLDFEYDPQAPPLNLMVQHHQPKSSLKASIEWVGGRFDDVIKLLIGLFIGLWFKVYEDRKKARQTIAREIKGIKESSDTIVANYQELQSIAEAYGRSETQVAAEKRKEFIERAKATGTQVDELNKQLDAKTAFEEAVFAVHKVRGRNDYAAFRSALKEIKKLTESIGANPGTILDAADRDARLKPFQMLRDTNFLGKY